MPHEILCGDVRTQLKTITDQSIATCVTSPPYFGLRDYGMSEQIGLEQTPDEYVTELVGVFREVRRVLKNDGTLWMNLGDSYAGAGYSNHDINGTSWKENMNGDKRTDRQQQQVKSLKTIGIKAKDLIGIPWRVAFALQADGWYLRQDIIWHKPNPMPESVTDRCTKAHEYLFLLTKSPQYYFDAKAIREESVYPAGTKAAKGSAVRSNTKGVNSRPPEYKVSDGYRNKRSVWTVNTRPHAGAHFATFPPDLIRPCILAGSKIGDTVLDPFLGSGTTLAVAKELGRNGVGVELNPKYVTLAEERLQNTASPLPFENDYGTEEIGSL